MGVWGVRANLRGTFGKDVEWSKVLYLVTHGAVSSSSVIPGSMLCCLQQSSVFWARKTLSNSIARFLAEVAKGAHLGPGDAL